MTARPSSSLGKRLLPALVLTSAASGLVALLDRPSGGAADGLGVDRGSGTAALPDPTVPTPTAGPTSTTLPALSSTTPAVVGQAPATPTAPTPTTVTPQPSAGSTCEGQTVDGPTIDTRWGPVQVEAVVSSTGQICNVDAIQSPSDHRRSVSINRNALPILHTEVMDAQSTNINGVSGATVTSVGYVRSLQAILDGVGG